MSDQYTTAPASAGLTDNQAGALAYVTIIPAILFLIMDPYSKRPFVRFHAFQCLAIALEMFVCSFINIIPILGQIIFLFLALYHLVIWVIALANAYQGKKWLAPIIGKFADQFAAQQ